MPNAPGGHPARTAPPAPPARTLGQPRQRGARTRGPSSQEGAAPGQGETRGEPGYHGNQDASRLSRGPRVPADGEPRSGISTPRAVSTGPARWP